MKRYDVVCAVVVNDGKVLCMQRPVGKYSYTSLHWEFPGGKIEPGETPEDALRRELLEEMDYCVNIERKLFTSEYDYPDFHVTLQGFLCTAESRDFVMKEHVAFRWLPVTELSSLDWCPADVPIVEAFVRGNRVG